MTRLIFPLLSAIIALAITIPSQSAKQPNIIVLFADDLGYGELSIQGNPEIPTPHIDSIAANGVRFTSGYATGPNCSPSRAGLISGRIPTRFGYENNPIGHRNEDPTIGFPHPFAVHRKTTIAETLQDRWLRHRNNRQMAFGRDRGLSSVSARLRRILRLHSIVRRVSW